MTQPIQRLFALAAFAAIAAVSCGGGETAAPPPPSREAAERAAESGAGSIAGLRVPAPGEVFTIGDEQWVVEAATISRPSAGVQRDTQVIDVTVQVRRQAAEPVEYLGEDDDRSPPDEG